MWGKLQILLEKCRFYRKTPSKIEEMDGVFLYEEWFLGIDSEISLKKNKEDVDA